MNIVVCIKQIVDPEAPDRTFAIDPVTSRQDRNRLSLVASPFDLNACEVALRLRDGLGGQLTALTIGPPEATQVLRQALGLGFGAGVLLNDPSFHDADPFKTAYVLSRAIRKLGPIDLILTGCESGDMAGAAVGPLIAEELAIGCITYASRISAARNGLEIHRTLSHGYELLHASPPLVVTVISDHANGPRLPKLRDLLASAKQPIPVWTALDIGIDVERFAVPPMKVKECTVVVTTRERACAWIVGETVQEQARDLVRRLRDRHILGSETRPS